MDSFVTKIKTNLNGVLQMTQIIDGIMMTGDDRANQIIVELHRDREPYEIPTGTKIVGYFMRSDGVTLEIEGSVVDTNHVMVIVPALAYQIPGVLSIAIRMFVDPSQEEQRGYYTTDTNEFVLVTDPNVTEGPNGEPVLTRTSTVYANKIVIAAASCFVQITETSTIIEPGHLIPDIQDVIAKLAELDAMHRQISTAESSRVSAEELRISAESIRESNETARVAAESDRSAAETLRISAEQARATAEQTRITNETARSNAEAIRAANEANRISAESDRSAAETLRISAEQARATTEQTRITNETARSDAEAIRITNETARVAAENDRAAAEALRISAENTRIANENTRISNESARVDAETARQYAIDNLSIDAEQLPYEQPPTATITDVGGHKHIHLGITAGMPFKIKKTFPSVAAMTAYTGTDVVLYDMVVITSNVEDPNNARLYMKNTSGWFFITDLSGATGVQGPQGPRGISMSNVTLNPDYTLTIGYSDGSSQTTGPIRGERGETGISIVNIEDNQDYTLTITMSDGSSYTTGSMRGPKGEPGAGGTDLVYNAQSNGLTVLFG